MKALNKHVYIYIYVCVSIYLSPAKVLVGQCVQLFMTPWTVAHQAPLSVGILQGFSQPRDQTWVAGRFFTIWTIREYRYTYIHWKRKWQPFLVFLPGESHVQRSLGGYTVHGVPGVRHNLPTKLPSPPYIYMVIYIYIKPLENIFHFIYLFIYFAVK